MSIRGIEASISIAVMLVVRNAPVIVCRDLFCIIDKLDSNLPLLDFQNAGNL